MQVETATKELEAVLAESSYRQASRHYFELLARVYFDEEPFDTWAHAVLALRDRGIVGAEEAVYFLAQLGREASLRDYEQDAELRSIREEMDIIARAHGREPGWWWGHGPFPDEWITLDLR